MSDHEWTVDEDETWGPVIWHPDGTCLTVVATDASDEDRSIVESERAACRRVAAALNGTADLTALADALAEFDRLHAEFLAEDSDDIDRIVAVATPLPPARDAVIAVARALVASTGRTSDGS